METLPKEKNSTVNKKVLRLGGSFSLRYLKGYLKGTALNTLLGFH